MCGSYSEGDEWEDEVEEYLDDLEMAKLDSSDLDDFSYIDDFFEEVQ